jgi:hypothetical protein
MQVSVLLESKPSVHVGQVNMTLALQQQQGPYTSIVCYQAVSCGQSPQYLQ